MSTINVYKYAGKSGMTYAMIFRYAVISSVWGMEIPKDIELKKFSDETVDTLKAEKHSETADRLIFLYGAGVISEETAVSLIKANKADFCEDIIAAEEAVISGINENAEDTLPYGQIENILLCAANSKKYSEIQPVSFAEAQIIAGLSHIVLVNGFVKIKDRNFYEFLVNFGEAFGTVTKDDTIRIEETPENLLECEEVKQGDIKSAYYPFAVNLRKIMRYAAVFDKTYGREFILFAKENSLPVDEKFESRYEEYVKKFKLHFTVKSYSRKRYICGDKTNWFDYAVTSEANVSDNLPADYTKEIDIEISEKCSDEKLVNKAVEKFRGIVALPENAVIEVFHGTKKYLYILKNSELTELDNDKFHTLLFDFNKIWSIIQLCSRSRQIKVVDGKMTIPETLMNEIAQNEREYAERIIKEQYTRMTEQRKNNKLIQTLSEIKAAAEAERAKMNEQQAAKDKKQKEIADKKAGRGSGTED